MNDGPLCIRDHDKPALATTGYLCDHHDDLLRGWLADVQDWFLQRPEFYDTATDAVLGVTDPRGGWNETGGELRPDAPARTLAFLRHLNPLTGRLESNGPDVPNVPALIDTWSQVLLEECPSVTVQPEAFAARVAGLRINASWIEHQPWLDEFMDDVRACQKALARMVGEATGPHPLGKCPGCSTNVYLNRDLEEWASRREHRERVYLPVEQVTCQGCGEQWTGTAVVRLRMIQEAS